MLWKNSKNSVDQKSFSPGTLSLGSFQIPLNTFSCPSLSKPNSSLNIVVWVPVRSIHWEIAGGEDKREEAGESLFRVLMSSGRGLSKVTVFRAIDSGQ